MVRTSTNDATSARDRILRAAARLYALHGYRGTSLSRIAAAAGVTKPLIHYHFQSKENLFGTLMRQSIEACRSASREILAEDVPAARKLRRMIAGHVARARVEPAVYAFVHEALTMPGLLPLGFDYKAHGRQLFEELVGLVEEGQRRGEFREINPRAVSATLIAALGMHLFAVLSGDLPEIPEDLEETLYDLILHGLEMRDR